MLPKKWRRWNACPSIPAKQIKDFVIEQIKKVGYPPDLLRDVVTLAHEKAKCNLKELEGEKFSMERDMARWLAEIHKTTLLIRPNETDSPAVARLADLQERVRQIESRMTTIRNEIHQITK